MTSNPLPLVADPGALTVASALTGLSEGRLHDLCRHLGCDVRERAGGRDRLARRLAEHVGRRLEVVLRELGRDELRAVCRRHGVDPSSRARSDLQRRLLEAAGIDPAKATVPPPAASVDGLPVAGQVVHARHRQWLVEDVVVPPAATAPDESPLVRLVCLDDDDPGRRLDVLWDLELGARVIAPATQGLGDTSRLDPADHFGAYLHALKWSAVSASDATRFQAPFRAGIKLMAHQLTPLMKALELPRANLFIADDVGLGKTIEAGLVLQELLLRQQASFVLVACPASVCLQWQGEMQRRFGLRFEVMTRQFVSYRRQERGFGANPWGTHQRFIISHSLLRRPEYRDPLIQHLGDRARKGLLILDEAHAAAPASASKYAVDTDLTKTIRDLAPRFDNRLFLSATPHNGHSNSFSALLEILDPARFTRGVPVQGKKDLEPIMVRRLKRDLRQLGVEKFPRRVLVEFALTHADGRWTVTRSSHDAETGAPREPVVRSLGPGAPVELELADQLARYTELCAPASGQGRLAFVLLQQRLLSSPEAFARTLEAHAAGVEKRGGVRAASEQQVLDLAQASEPTRTSSKKSSKDSTKKPTSKARAKAKVATKLAKPGEAAQRAEGGGGQADGLEDPETHGVSEDQEADELEVTVRQASEALPTPTEEAQGLLRELRAQAARSRRQPDAKALALLDWMREALCPALGLCDDTKASRAWTDRRVILFTEYADTKRWLVGLLSAAAEFTDRGDERVLQFHGGMGDDAREQVQKAFNARPADHPVRILVATDAAREGVNLQGACADLFHIDIPWNPSRLEQRNGRIDRTLQPADEVRCASFFYPQRAEDQVLKTVVRKVDTVQRELGSLGAVLLGQLEKALEGGLSKKAREAVERIGSDARTSTVEAELDEGTRELDAVRAEVDRAGRRLESSRKALEVNPESLRGVVEIGLRMAGAKPLARADKTNDGRDTFELPELDASWDATLDTLRPARGRAEAFWEWRKKKPNPVTFHPLNTLTSEVEQLHLAHPLVRRILDRFLAQGFGAHDLSRVTAVVAPDDSVVRAIAYARFTLFGPGAVRLHDQLVPVAAAWSGEATSVKPYKDRATAVQAIATVEKLLSSGAKAPNATIAKRIRDNSVALFQTLWPHLEAEADTFAVEARKGLAERARSESGAIRKILERQGDAIDKARRRLAQVDYLDTQDREQRRQVELDLKHLDRRQADAARELVSEPAAIEALYDVRMSRLSAVGLVVAWPESMT